MDRSNSIPPKIKEAALGRYLGAVSVDPNQLVLCFDHGLEIYCETDVAVFRGNTPAPHMKPFKAPLDVVALLVPAFGARLVAMKLDEAGDLCLHFESDVWIVLRKERDRLESYEVRPTVVSSSWWGR